MTETNDKPEKDGSLHRRRRGYAPLLLRIPIPSQPFPFLKFPREIRDSIYYHALLRPRNSPCVIPTLIRYFNFKPRAGPASQSYWYSYWYPYWGTKQATQLFLVNRQLSNEALEAFYSAYLFQFPPFADNSLVNSTLRDTLLPWARSLITNIGFEFNLHNPTESSTFRGEEKAKQAMEAAVDLLPNIRRVVLTLTFSGHDVPEDQVEEVVTRALNATRPLRRFPGLSLKGFDAQSAQQTRILGRCAELSAGSELDKE